jgi:hypothetical protein
MTFAGTTATFGWDAAALDASTDTTLFAVAARNAGV